MGDRVIGSGGGVGELGMAPAWVGAKTKNGEKVREVGCAVGLGVGVILGEFVVGGGEGGFELGAKVGAILIKTGVKRWADGTAEGAGVGKADGIPVNVGREVLGAACEGGKVGRSTGTVGEGAGDGKIVGDALVGTNVGDAVGTGV